MEAKVKYITDENGDKTAVVIPIEEWNSWKEELIKIKEFQELKKSLEHGFKDVDDMISGKKPEKTFDQFLEEL